MKLTPLKILIIACLIVIGLPVIATVIMLALPFLLLFIIFGSPVTHRHGSFRWPPRGSRKTEQDVNGDTSGINGEAEGDVCDVECKVLKTETVDDDDAAR